MPGTPRGESELLDFDELERIEAERAAEELPVAEGAVAQAELGPSVTTRATTTKAAKKEVPFEDFQDVLVGMKVQVLSDSKSVLEACRRTGIDTTYDEQRLACLGKVASVQCKDPSDYTVRCKLPELGSIWFGLSALTPAAVPREDDDSSTSRPPLLERGGPDTLDWMAAGGIVACRGAKEGGAASAVDVMAELELEAAVERRLSEGERKGKLGSTFGLKDGSLDADGQPKWTFVADAIIAVIVRFRKLTASARIFAEGLDFFLLGVGHFMSMTLPCRFRGDASVHVERLVRLLQERRGFLPLTEELLGGDLSEAQALALWKRLEAVLKDCLACLRKFQGCLVSPTEAEEAHVAASLVELEAITTSGLEHRPSWLREWGEGLLRHGKGRTLVIRTSRVTIAQLLQELLQGFRKEHFQERYLELRAEAKHGGAAHVRMVEWTFEVQRQVLSRYGFEASARGVWDMRAETGFHADGIGEAMTCGADEVVAKLRRDIHICLEMDVKGSVRLPVFHTVGDSHSRFGWPACVIQHWQGPLLCYNVDRVDLRKLQPPIREGDAICLCFGEIDCRCHVHKRITPEKTFQDVIDVIIGRYFEHLRRQVRLLPPAVRIFVYNVLPPVRKANAELNTEFPYLGEDEERLEYVRYFNKRLKRECHHTEFRFFDVYDQYADEEGFLSQQFSDGSVHVADGVWIDEVIRGLDLKPVRVSELSFAA